MPVSYNRIKQADKTVFHACSPVFETDCLDDLSALRLVCFQNEQECSLHSQDMVKDLLGLFADSRGKSGQFKSLSIS